MKTLWTNKHFYFAAFGAAGGLVSGAGYALLGFNDDVFLSWVAGTGLDGLFIGGLLALAHARYVGKVFDAKGIGQAMLIGGLGGAAGGLVALYGGFPLAALLGGAEDAGRFLGWALGGAAVGAACARVIPNLKWRVAIAAGALGGLIGCALMYLVGSLTVGIAVTGASIGLAIALAETAFREAWLEITIRPTGLSLQKERTLTVSLGPQPIQFGCGQDADVKVAERPDAGAHLAQVSFAGGRVMLLDQVSGASRALAINETFEVSNARAVVRTKMASIES